MNRFALTFERAAVLLGTERFAGQALPAPTAEEVLDVAWETCLRTRNILERHGRWEDEGLVGEDPLLESEPGLAGLYQASVRGRIGWGPRRGQRLGRFVAEAAGGEEDPGVRRTGWMWSSRSLVPLFSGSEAFTHAWRFSDASNRDGFIAAADGNWPRLRADLEP